MGAIRLDSPSVVHNVPRKDFIDDFLGLRILMELYKSSPRHLQKVIVLYIQRLGFAQNVEISKRHKFNNLPIIIKVGWCYDFKKLILFNNKKSKPHKKPQTRTISGHYQQPHGEANCLQSPVISSTDRPMPIETKSARTWWNELFPRWLCLIQKIQFPRTLLCWWWRLFLFW